MRDLPATIDRLLQVIPESEESLRAALMSIQQTALYNAPEAQANYWADASSVLATQIGPPRKDWHHEVVRIWNGRED